MPEYGDGHKGERRLAEVLKLIAGPSTHLWFGLDYLPSVPDLDLLVWHGQVGVFAVEVKAFDLAAIESAGLREVNVRGRSSTLHPLHQAKRAADRLSAFLKDVSPERVPYLHATACFPLITRGEWLQRWPDERMALQSLGMLFSDDLIDEASFKAALLRVRDNPAVGPGTTRPFRASLNALDALVAALDPGVVPEAALEDVDRLRQFESALDADLQRRFPVGLSGRVMFTGDAGTGKTYRLLQMAVSRARAGQDVLFLTFNKVLAADLRRWVSGSVNSVAGGGAIDVVDAWQFLNRFFDPAPDFGSVYDVVGELVKQERTGYLIDAVCIDEAQDMADWVYWLARWASREDAAWFVARGGGQELYDERTGWLDDFGREASSEHLTTVFRTGRADFVAASLFARYAPDATVLTSVVPAPHGLPGSRRRLAADQVGMFDEAAFARGLGAVPILTSLREPDDEVPRRRHLISQYGELIATEMAQLEIEATPGDLMILVPGADDDSVQQVRVALAERGVEYVDLIDKESRRLVPRPGAPRLMTIHSSRGLEAARVLVVGFHRIAGMGPIEYQRRLGYIALSRASSRTTVALPKAVVDRPWDHIAFLGTLLAVMRTKGWS
jgi:hypothetical protein